MNDNRLVRLKRPVEVAVRFWPQGSKSWLRNQPSDHWEATLRHGPKKLVHLAHRAATKDEAVKGLLEKVRQLGYSGTAKVIDG